jgi:hypothetical protein
MNNITTDHLSRAAYVYVRQSTPGQLINHPESRRRQYLPTAPRLWVWSLWSLSMKISVTPDQEPCGRDSTVCWQRSAPAQLVPSSQ